MKNIRGVTPIVAVIIMAVLSLGAIITVTSFGVQQIKQSKQETAEMKKDIELGVAAVDRVKTVEPFADSTYRLGDTGKEFSEIHGDDINFTNATGTNIIFTSATGTNATTTGSLNVDGDLTVDGQTTLNAIAYTWPSSDGSSGQVLHTDGAGTLTWDVDDSGSGSSFAWTNQTWGASSNTTIGLYGGFLSNASSTAQDLRVTTLNASSTLIDSLNLTNDLSIANGGTGASSLTDGGILLGSGTSAITAMSVLSDGYLVIGDGATDPTTIQAFTASNGVLRHEVGGLELDISAITTGDILYGDGAGSVAILNAGSDGEVLKLASGVPTWDTDATGGGGTGSNWSFGGDQTFIYPSTTVGTIVSASSTFTSTVTFAGADDIYIGDGTYNIFASSTLVSSADITIYQGGSADLNLHVTDTSSNPATNYITPDRTWSTYVDNDDNDKFSLWSTGNLNIFTFSADGSTASSTLVANLSISGNATTTGSFDAAQYLQSNTPLSDIYVQDGCTDCLNATEIEDIYLLIAGDTSSGNYTWTGTHDFGGGTIEVPNGTSKTLSAIGQPFLDITANQFRIATNTTNAAGAVFARNIVELYSFSVPSTSLAWQSGSFKLGHKISPFVVTGIVCSATAENRYTVLLTDSGSTNDTNSISCGTDTPTAATSTTANYGWNAFEDIYIEFANKSGNIDNAVITVAGYYDDN